jgi:hypothetical protein
VSLLNGRPSANNFSNADILQQWTKATDIRLRLIRTKTLLGHLMAVERQDPTVTRRVINICQFVVVGLYIVLFLNVHMYYTHTHTHTHTQNVNKQQR